ALPIGAMLVTARPRARSRWRSLGWAVVAAFFTYMAIDDGTQFHERIGTAVSVMHRRGAGPQSGDLFAAFPSYAWQIVFVPGLALLGAFTLLFLGHEIP